jgi:hypothetical protein
MAEKLRRITVPVPVDIDDWLRVQAAKHNVSKGTYSAILLSRVVEGEQEKELQGSKRDKEIRP